MSENTTPANGKIWQPLHPSLRTKLDPQYVAFHDAYIQYVQPDDTKVWDGSARTSPSLPPGGSAPVPVGSTEDVQLDKFAIRVFTPEGTPDGDDQRGWPLFVWFHGGGFAVGNIDSDKDVCTRLCQQSRCVVANVDYRLAPEHPYPAAVEDGEAAVRWLLSATGGLSRFRIDAARVALGGTSAGGLLSAITALRCASTSPTISLIRQILIVPMIDNTATAESPHWRVNGPTAPWLTPARMLWYRRMWLPDEADAGRWDASVNYAPKELLVKMPPTWMAVAEADLLAPEGLAFAEQLREVGVTVQTVVLGGCTHSILPLNGIMDKGRQLINDAAAVLEKAFWES